MSDMKVELIDHMGTDLTVVNTARVSFGNTVDTLTERDKRLIGYLAEHGHWSPFAHTCLQFRIKAPIFVARQLAKHQVGLTWNEISRRYVKTDIEFYEPDYWRKADKDIKQGSGGAVDDLLGAGLLGEYRQLSRQALETYELLLSEDVCPEQARMLLPQSMMTEWIWTGSLVAFARIVEQRTHSTAQRETQVIARLINDCITEVGELQYSWKAVTKNKLEQR